MANTIQIRFIAVASIFFTEAISLPTVGKNSLGRNANLLNEEEITKLSGEQELIKSIEKYVATVPLIHFEGDVVLLQFPNRMDKKTDYRHVNPELINKIIYETNSLDIDKEVVVLRSSQDHIEAIGQKKVFVVLRRNNVMGDSRLYYVSYLYIKDPVPGQRGVHNFGDRQVALEWDFWDNREQKESKSHLEVISSCYSTIFVPCITNETIDFPIPRKPNGPLKVPGNLPNKQKTELPANNKTFTLQDGSDKYYDFFKDLDRNAKLGRSMQFDFQSMSQYLKNKPATSEDNEGQVLTFLDSDMKKFHTKIQTVVEAGMGLIKSYNGRYGGLGTPEANVAEVLRTLVNLEHPEIFEESLTKDEFEELEDQMKLPSSGGLGGMINADEMREAEEEGLFKNKNKKKKSGRRFGNALSADNSEDTNGPYVKYGWNTDSDSNSQNDPFVGFGACRYHQVTLRMFKNSSSNAALIKLYQTILKTQCITKDTKLYEQILSEGIINIDDNKMSFTVNENSETIKQEKLPQMERIRLYRGLELSFFSKVYLEQLSLPSEAVAPDNAPLSKNVFTLGKMILRGLSSKSIPVQHSIKLGRNLVKTLRQALSKLAEDNNVNSLKDKEANFNDRVYLVGLIQFIIHSYGAIFINPNFDVQKGFELFYEQNRELLEDKINLY